MSSLYETPATIEQDIRHLGGVAVVFGSQETWGLLETRVEQSFDAPDVSVSRTVLTVATGVLTGLAQSKAITAAGEPYEILSADRTNDGAETEITLRARNPRNRKHRGA